VFTKHHTEDALSSADFQNQSSASVRRSTTRSGSTSVRGPVRSPHTSAGRPAAGSQRAYSLGTAAPWDRQTDRPRYSTMPRWAGRNNRAHLCTACMRYDLMMLISSRLRCNDVKLVKPCCASVYWLVRRRSIIDRTYIYSLSYLAIY